MRPRTVLSLAPRPRGGLRIFHQNAICLTQSTSAPYVVQIWSRYDTKIEAKNLRTPPGGPYASHFVSRASV